MQQFVFKKKSGEPHKNELFGTEIKDFILFTEIYDVRVLVF